MSSWATINTSSGFVGIGTAANSTNCISLYTSTTSSSNQTLITSTTNFANIQFNNNFSCNAYIGIGCTNITGNYSCNLFLQADKNIVFNTGGNIFSTTVPSMVILANGNVGIGSSIPNTKLDISGIINITNGVNSVPSFTSAYGGTGDRIVFLTGTGGSVYPYSIGINTSSFWHSVPTNATHDFYVNGVAIAQINSSGFVTNNTFSITSGSSLTCKSLSLTSGDISLVRNIVSSGQISTTSNITASGLLLGATDIGTVRNIVSTGQISTTSNITASGLLLGATDIGTVRNIVSTGQISTTSNITASGLLLGATDIGTVRNIVSTGQISTSSNITASGLLLGTTDIGTVRNIVSTGAITTSSNITTTGSGSITSAGSITGVNLILNSTDILSVRNINSTGLITTTSNVNINGTNSCLIFNTNTNSVGIASTTGSFSDSSVSGDMVIRSANNVLLLSGIGAAALKITTTNDAYFSGNIQVKANIGIGASTTTQNQLYINTISSSSSNQILIASTSNFANIQFNNGITSNAFIGIGCSNITGNYSNNMFLETTNSIVFNAGGINAWASIPDMIISSNGNVGIGISNPSTKLTVTGGVSYLSSGISGGPSTTAIGTDGLSIMIYGGASSSQCMGFGFANSQLWYNVPTGNYHNFFVAGTSIFQINSGGLSVTGGITATGLTLTTNDIASVRNITSTGAITTTSNVGIGTVASATTGNCLRLYSSAANSGDQLLITGTSTTGMGNIRISNGGANDSYIGLGGSTYTGNYQANLFIQSPTSLVFNTNGNTSTSLPTMIITSTSNVGIGKTNPGTALDVNGVINISNVGGTLGAPSVGIYGTAGASAGDRIILYPGTATIYPYSIGVNSSVMWYSVPTGASHLFYIGGGTAISTISNTGLSVNANISTTGTGSISSATTITATGNISTSGTGTITAVNGNISTTGSGNITTTGTGSISSATTITSTGNVGIGTAASATAGACLTLYTSATSSQDELSIIATSASGTANMRFNNGSTSSFIGLGGTTYTGNYQANLYIQSPTSLVFNTNGNTSTSLPTMILTSTSNVGIGTTNPASRLHVLSATSSLITVDSTDAGTPQSGIQFGIPTFTAANRPKILSTKFPDNKADLSFYINNSTANSFNCFTLTSNGDVAIGAINGTLLSTIEQRLIAYGGNYSGAGVTSGVFGGDLLITNYWGVAININSGGWGDTGGSSAASAKIYGSSSFTINTRSTSSTTSFDKTLFTVRNSGSVGIGSGNTNPQQLLHVRGASPSMVRVDTNTDAVGQISGIEFGIPSFVSANSAKIISTTIAGNKADLQFLTTNGSTSTSAMIINEAGCVGIGTTTSLTEKLTVNGNIIATGKASITNSVGIGTNATGVAGDLIASNIISPNYSVNVFYYPPSSLINYTTTISGQSYGNGIYTVSTSSTYNAGIYPYNTFNILTDTITITNNYWVTASNSYNNSTGSYSSMTNSTNINGTSTFGDWIQLQYSSGFIATGINLVLYTPAYCSPATFFIVASNDGSTWTLLYNQSTPITPATEIKGPYVFSWTNTTSYTYYRFIILTISTINTSGFKTFNGSAAITNLVFFNNNGNSLTTTITISSNLNINNRNTYTSLTNILSLDAAGNLNVLANITGGNVGTNTMGTGSFHVVKMGNGYYTGNNANIYYTNDAICQIITNGTNGIRVVNTYAYGYASVNPAYGANKTGTFLFYDQNAKQIGYLGFMQYPNYIDIMCVNYTGSNYYGYRTNSNFVVGRGLQVGYIDPTNALSIAGTNALTINGTSYFINNVGIGTATAGTALDVNGVINVSNVGGTLAAPSNTGVYGGTGDRIILSPGVAGGKYPFAIGMNTNTMWFSVPQSGCFLWSSNTTGTTTTSNMYLDNGGNLNVYNDISCFTSASDIKLKENIKPLELNCVDLINHINPVEFTWKDITNVPGDKKNTIDYGFIAQEVEELLPHLVKDTASYKTIRYEKFAPYLVKAIQELSSTIIKLESKIVNLTNEIEILKNK